MTPWLRACNLVYYYVDVETTFREEVEMKMTNLFRQTKFNACHGYLRRQLADYADKFGRLKASAILYTV